MQITPGEIRAAISPTTKRAKQVVPLRPSFLPSILNLASLLHRPSLAVLQALVDDRPHLPVRLLRQLPLHLAQVPLLLAQLALFLTKLALGLAELALPLSHFPFQLAKFALNVANLALNVGQFLLAHRAALLGVQLGHRLIQARHFL